jgi:ATP-binding cassette subfamily B protein
VLVLDEATSSLDSVAERCVQQALAALRGRGRTILVIAHRLATVAGADRIVVVEEGRVAEEGTHEELLRRGGSYAQLWRHQVVGAPDAESPAGDLPERAMMTVGERASFPGSAPVPV